MPLRFYVSSLYNPQCIQVHLSCRRSDRPCRLTLPTTGLSTKGQDIPRWGKGRHTNSETVTTGKIDTDPQTPSPNEPSSQFL